MVYAPGRLDYLDLLSVLNFLTMAEAFATAATPFSSYSLRESQYTLP